MALNPTPDSHPLANVYARLRELVTFLNGAEGIPTLAAGVVATNGEGPTVRRRGAVVSLTAEVLVQSNLAQNAALMTLPVGFRPVTRRVQLVVMTGTNDDVVGLIDTAGTLRLPFSGVGSSTTLFLSQTWCLT